jgi:hypothetical protein
MSVTPLARRTCIGRGSVNGTSGEVGGRFARQDSSGGGAIDANAVLCFVVELAATQALSVAQIRNKNGRR